MKTVTVTAMARVDDEFELFADILQVW